MQKIVYDPSHPSTSETRREFLARWMEDLRKIEGRSLGFVPRDTFLMAINRGRVLITADRIGHYTAPAGFLLWGVRRNVATIHMLAVIRMSRRRGHATALLTCIEADPSLEHVDTIRLGCREDLTANHFWLAAGYHVIGTRGGGLDRTQTEKQVNIWMKAKSSICSTSTARSSTPNTT